MIKSYTNGEWKEPGSLCQAVGIYKEDFHKIVSVVGGGGKTTVIRAMLRECMENSDGRIPCAVSTTTHIQKTNAEYFLGELENADIDVAMCGHAHGGQMRIPGVGGPYTKDQGWFPKYVDGIHHFRTVKNMIVTRGLGSDKEKLPRFNNIPEIVVIDLKK